jgi:hypothetical protein
MTGIFRGGAQQILEVEAERERFSVMAGDEVPVRG